MTRFGGDFLRLCEGAHAAARRAWGPRFLGLRPAPSTLAAGSEASGDRDYVTGDDFRYVDWNRAARLDELVSKQFFGSELQRVDVLLDASASMGIGTATHCLAQNRPLSLWERVGVRADLLQLHPSPCPLPWGEGSGITSKFSLAQELAAALGCWALAEAKSVRLRTFGDEEPQTFDTFRGRAAWPRWLRAIENLSPPRDRVVLTVAERALLREPLTVAARAILREPRRGNVVIVLSDLLETEGIDRGCELLRSGGCALHLIQIAAPEDVDPRVTGAVRLQDVETGSWLIPELDDEDLENYRHVFGEFCASIRGYCARRGIGLAQFRSDAPLKDCLRRLIEGGPATSDTARSPGPRA